MDSSDTRQHPSQTSKDLYTETIGIDDGPFQPRWKNQTNQENYAPLLAVLVKGFRVESLKIGRIRVDGLDGTQKTLRLLHQLPKRPVILSGVTVGGFNLIDPRVLQNRLKVPVIVVIGSKPNRRSIKQALVRHFPDWKKRWRIIGSLGPINSLRTVSNEPNIYFEPFGCSVADAKALLKKTVLVSRLPEPTRIAGMIARGIFPTTHPSETRRHPS